jgi:DNA-binding CsgD family transcriptional regulator
MIDPILSSREKRLLRRLGRGYSDLKIAAELGGRADQISDQRKRLLEKLRVNSQIEIGEAAVRLAPYPTPK